MGSEMCIRDRYYPDNPDDKYINKLGFPGQYPYTRGVHANMYRGKLWTMRQFSGYGSPEESNKRYHYLLNQGQTGLSIAYDMPTLMGYDPDHPISIGEVGKCGVSVASLNDMEALLKDVDLSKVSISQTINCLLYTSPSPRDLSTSRMPSSA